ncbi:hypothetical protein E6O75_ATG01027 [Venturia nashicola]|uniref:EGF-like domain-containing protein n=1 Tax=Venturia nashicola TaxID=86259 RepID=A0A4Z1PFT8_9PEZI|nr:hypothetical protein E6O75_ATG01027 [Venturia nashicola]
MQFHVLLLSSTIALIAATSVEPQVALVKKGDCNPGPRQKCRCQADDGYLGKECKNGGDCPTRNDGHHLVRYTCVPVSIKARMVHRQSPKPSVPKPEMPWTCESINIEKKLVHRQSGKPSVPQVEMPWTCRDGDECQCVSYDRIPYGESCTEDESCWKHHEDHKWCISPPFMTGRSMPGENEHKSTQNEVASRDAQGSFQKKAHAPGTCNIKHLPCYCVDRTGDISGHLNKCLQDSDCEGILSQTRCDSPPFSAARSIPVEAEVEPSQEEESAGREAQQLVQKDLDEPGTYNENNSCSSDSQCEGILEQARRDAAPFPIRRSAQDEYVHKQTQKEAAGRPIDASNPGAAWIAEENKKPAPDHDAKPTPIPR